MHTIKSTRTLSLALAILFTAGCGSSNNDSTPDPIGPVTDLVAAEGSGSIDLVWTNPTTGNQAGALVVVRAGQAVSFSPTDGTTHSDGEDLGSGQTVLSTALGTSASLTPFVPGVTYHFSVWAFDDETAYSAAETTTHVINTLGTQSGTLSIDLASGTVTVTNQPANLFLSGTAVYDDPGDAITLSLEVRNDTGRLIFNLKEIFGSLNEGAQGGPTMLSTMAPYTYYGPESLEVGGTRSRDIGLTGITGGTDPIVLDLNFEDAPMVYTSESGNTRALDSSISGQANDVASISATRRSVALSPDGRFLYGGNKEDRVLEVMDTTTSMITASVDLGVDMSGDGCIPAVAMSSDAASVFVLVNDGSHWHGTINDGSGTRSSATTADLVELNANTLAEIRRTNLYTGAANAKVPSDVELSPDGTTLAISVSTADGDMGELWFVDAASLAVIDTDTGMAGDQPVDLGDFGMARYLDWSPDGGRVMVGYNAQNQSSGSQVEPPLTIVNTSTYAATQFNPTAGAGVGMSPSTFHGDAYYFASRNGTNGFTILEADGSERSPDPGITEVMAVHIHPLLPYYFIVGHNDLRVLDLATDALVDAPGVPGTGAVLLTGHWHGHATLITPF